MSTKHVGFYSVVSLFVNSFLLGRRMTKLILGSLIFIRFAVAFPGAFYPDWGHQQHPVRTAKEWRDPATTPPVLQPITGPSRVHRRPPSWPGRPRGSSTHSQDHSGARFCHPDRPEIAELRHRGQHAEVHASSRRPRRSSLPLREELRLLLLLIFAIKWLSPCFSLFLGEI